MTSLIERSLQIVALRALDTKDGCSVFAMTEYEANELKCRLIDMIALELSDSLEQCEEFKKQLFSL